MIQEAIVVIRLSKWLQDPLAHYSDHTTDKELLKYTIFDVINLKLNIYIYIYNKK